jgi:hypothetical protein
MFSGCISLKTIIIAGNYVLQNCRLNLYGIGNFNSNSFFQVSINYVYIPSTLSSFNFSYLYQFNNLTSLEIDRDESYQAIPLNSFPSLINCTALPVKIIENNVLNLSGYNYSSTSLPSSCYSGLGLISAYIPSSITPIGSNCFMNCKNLERVEFQYQITTISDFLFSGCTLLKTINIAGNYFLQSGRLNLFGVLSFNSSSFSQVPINYVYIPSSLSSFTFSYLYQFNNLISLEIDYDNSYQIISLNSFPSLINYTVLGIKIIENNVLNLSE